jgi:NAD(P)-dependent dehydrogenase (short-subunit alcohol dehydrogenase family)
VSVSTRALDALIEGPVVPSFTQIGYEARSRIFDWKPLDSYDLTDRTIIITGGSSGLGYAAAEVFARLGANLVVVARNPEKTEQAVAALKSESGNDRIHGELADLSDLDQVRAASERIRDTHASIDVLIHNAGALLPERREAPDGTEITTQVMVAAPFLMTTLLLDPLRSAAPGRVITMSSGGMYTSGLTVADLQMDESSYNGPKQYARAKRAQVVLNEMWAAKVPKSEIVFHAMHPGWANTPGVDAGIPGFGKLMGPLLRSPEQGADTMVWLAADDSVEEKTGLFWHDRAVRSTHKFKSTARTDTPARREALWAWCEQHTGVSPSL